MTPSFTVPILGVSEWDSCIDPAVLEGAAVEIFFFQNTIAHARAMPWFEQEAAECARPPAGETTGNRRFR